MNSFLYRIAQTYFAHVGESISGYTFVFPNRRAGLFFQRCLSEIAGKPLFSPEILTINECFSMASSWQSADRLSMLFRLYRIYKDKSGSEESFDSFVFWGEMLLSDFNDVDRYRVDAEQLFTNITELKQIDHLFNVFSEKQVEVIREFWANFVPVAEGKTQENFIATWRILYPMYEQFREELLAENTATEGMICRDVADRLNSKESIPEYAGKQFVFVGFNALNPCERTLMAELQKLGQADFYWDYEAPELRDPDNQASRYYAGNLHVFPSKFEVEPWSILLENKEIELIGVPSAVGQAKQIHDILDKLHPENDSILSSNVSNTPKKNWINTAVVLPDESLLVPLLHSLPGQISKINITMGFPLKATPVSGLIEHVFELQRRLRTSGSGVSFYHQTVSNILNHQYIAFLCADEVSRIAARMAQFNFIYVDANELALNPVLSSIFTPQTEAHEFLPYLLNVLRSLQAGWQHVGVETKEHQLVCDFLYQYYITINRMHDIVRSKPDDVFISFDTLMRLTRQLTAGITIPFIGEPLDGLQVMGVLETRGLDFENLIITSFNEGVFPAKSSMNSFIPYNLRRGFELPTADYQDAIMAYNFYRLINRAKRVFFLYDSRTEGMQTGEVSRFMHQLYYHYGVKARQKTITFDVAFNNPQPIEIKKTPELMLKLLRFTTDNGNNPALSASSLNTYIDCPLQFYLTRVEEMEEAYEVMETVEASMFGSIFHKVMENLYERFKGNIIHKDDFEQLISDVYRIDNEIKKAFNTEYFKRKSGALLPLEGNNLLIASVLRKYILQVLTVDKLYAPFRYISSEELCTIQFPIHGGQTKVNLKGFIDRIDEKEGTLRILDYKTGTGKLDFKNLEEVFEHNRENRPKFVLQTFLYGIFYKEKSMGRTIVPGIYYIRDTFKDDFDTVLNDKERKQKVTDFSLYEDEFRDYLTGCLEEIFNPEVPFRQTENLKACEYCPYSGVCNR